MAFAALHPTTQRMRSMTGGGEPFVAKNVCSRCMSLLPRKALLAIAAVIDVALQTAGRPISAKILATRHDLPPRHLETVLQSLVRDGILKGIRGPRGGYELARERQHITAKDILQAAGTVDGAQQDGVSDLIGNVVIPVLAKAETEFGLALSRITLEDMVQRAETLDSVPQRTAQA
jgi:Rrf2 family transcriptional regulator, iron-sulfur cluster assembly transcription factor